MDKLICFINLFTYDQNIYLFNAATQETKVATNTTFEDLSTVLADISDITKVNHIELHGARKYANEIASEVLTYAKSRYNNNDLTVEVI